jgi:hypothetical protein
MVPASLALLTLGRLALSDTSLLLVPEQAA